MKIKWLGHSAFLVTANNGITVVTDPYTPSDTLRYGKIDMPADVVTVSHRHSDHANTAAVKGQPEIVDKPGLAIEHGIEFWGVTAFHDAEEGARKGSNIIFCFVVDGIRLCHAGDLGHALDKQVVEAIGPVDILMLPVGGNYTIDAATADRVLVQLKPRVVIPMHFRNEKCLFPIEGVDKFLSGKLQVKYLESSGVEVFPPSLPPETEIWVMKPFL